LNVDGVASTSEMIGRYRLVQLLGEGGMAQVYLASARGAAGFEKVVALKVLGARQVGKPAMVASLLREAMIGVRLDHENVVQVLDCGEDAGKYYVAMEYVRGFPLTRVIANSSRRPIPVAVAAHVARTVAGALAYVHAFAEQDGSPLGLIHGDVSPSNVLLAADGRIKLADFGVAALAREVEDKKDLAGKLPYLPLEAHQGAPASQGWDVYALGVMMYEMLVGKRPFPGRDLAAVHAAQRAGAPALSVVRPECPAALANVVERAIAREPGDRFAAAADLRDAIDWAFPRRVDDADAHRAFVAAIFADSAFLAANGPLTPKGGLPALAAVDDQVATETSAVRSKVSLRFGLSPARGVDRARAGGERLATYLSARLGCGVRTTVLGDYQTLVDGVATGEIDLAWMPPAAFAAAADRGVGALAVLRRDGQTSYESALIVRADSGLCDIADLRGKRVGWVDRESAAGYLFAAAEIVRILGPLDKVLGRQHFFGSHRDVCEAVADRWCDAGATYVVRSEDAITSSGWIDALGDRASEVLPIAFSVPIPGDSIAYRPGLSEGVRRDVTTALVAMANDDDGRSILADVFGADGFAPKDDSAPETVRARLRLL
jgi:phosphate/phosphite/phosphonate ABC transporter binding protein